MIYIYLAEGFEETEMIFPLDLMRRAGLEVRTVSVTGERAVTGSHGITVTADMTVSDSDYAPDSCELIMLPGGMPGTLNLEKSDEVQKALRFAFDNGRYIAAICAAPMVLGNAGLLEGKRAVCYPGFEQHLEGAVLTGGRVEVDGNYVTGCGMGAALEFSLALTRLLKGDEAADKLFAAVLAK